MARSETLAMAVCGGCICAGAWLLQHAAAPQIDVPSPLTASVIPVPVTVAGRTDAERWLQSADEAGNRTGWVQRFERPNAMDDQAEINRSAATSLAVVGPTERPSAGLPTLVLPPLVVEAAAGSDALVLADTAAGLETAGTAEPRIVADMETMNGGLLGGPNAAVLKHYKVAKGDTLSRIARREFESSDPRLVHVLLNANPLIAKRKGRLIAGEELLIPSAALANGLAGAGKAPSGDTALAALAPGSKAETASPRWYTIQRNDSLTSIAKRFLDDGQRWREILKLNGSLDPHKIQPGVKIKLPPGIPIAQR